MSFGRRRGGLKYTQYICTYCKNIYISYVCDNDIITTAVKLLLLLLLLAATRTDVFPSDSRRKRAARSRMWRLVLPKNYWIIGCVIEHKCSGFSVINVHKTDKTTASRIWQIDGNRFVRGRLSNSFRNSLCGRIKHIGRRRQRSALYTCIHARPIIILHCTCMCGRL